MDFPYGAFPLCRLSATVSRGQEISFSWNVKPVCDVWFVEENGGDQGREGGRREGWLRVGERGRGRGRTGERRKDKLLVDVFHPPLMRHRRCRCWELCPISWGCRWFVPAAVFVCKSRRADQIYSLNMCVCVCVWIRTCVFVWRIMEIYVWFSSSTWCHNEDVWSSIYL